MALVATCMAFPFSTIRFCDSPRVLDRPWYQACCSADRSPILLECEGRSDKRVSRQVRALVSFAVPMEAPRQGAIEVRYSIGLPVEEVLAVLTITRDAAIGDQTPARCLAGVNDP